MSTPSSLDRILKRYAPPQHLQRKTSKELLESAHRIEGQINAYGDATVALHNWQHVDSVSQNILNRALSERMKSLQSGDPITGEILQSIATSRNAVAQQDGIVPSESLSSLMQRQLDFMRTQSPGNYAGMLREQKQALQSAKESLEKELPRELAELHPHFAKMSLESQVKLPKKVKGFFTDWLSENSPRAIWERARKNGKQLVAVKSTAKTKKPSRKPSIELLKEARTVQDKINAHDNVQQALARLPLAEALSPDAMLSVISAGMGSLRSGDSQTMQRIKEISGFRNFLARQDAAVSTEKLTSMAERHFASVQGSPEELKRQLQTLAPSFQSEKELLEAEIPKDLDRLNPQFAKMSPQSQAQLPRGVNALFKEWLSKHPQEETSSLGQTPAVSSYVSNKRGIQRQTSQQLREKPSLEVLGIANAELKRQHEFEADIERLKNPSPSTVYRPDLVAEEIRLKKKALFDGKEWITSKLFSRFNAMTKKNRRQIPEELKSEFNEYRAKNPPAATANAESSQPDPATAIVAKGKKKKRK